MQLMLQAVDMTPQIFPALAQETESRRTQRRAGLSLSPSVCLSLSLFLSVSLSLSHSRGQEAA